MRDLRDKRSIILASAAIAAVYFAAGKLGLMLAVVHASATAVWAPTGIALAAFLLLGYRIWPGVLLGAFLVNITTAGSVVSSFGIAAGNTLEGLIGALLVNAFANGCRALERPQDIFKFTFLSAILGTAVSAGFGVTSLVLTGDASWSDYGPIWLTWWLGDAAGALIVAPVLLLWATTPLGGWNRGRVLEVTALLAALVLTGLLVFGGLQPLSVNRYPLEFLTFPVLVWAAIRFGPREVATGILLLAGIAIWGTLSGFGPFVGGSQHESLLLLQGFMGVTAVMCLALAAAVLERERAEQNVRAAEERLRLIEEREQAKEALAEAEAAVAERDEFLSVAAHELKTPMTSLHLAVQFLLRQFDRGVAVEPQVVRRALQAIEQQSSKLGRLVSQLMETVRYDTGRLELDQRVEDVTGLVERLVDEAQATTQRHQMVLTAEPEIMAVVDALRLEQVVGNLLDNAIKFSPEGDRIEVHVSSPTAGTVQVAVRDRGIGIPSERRADVFERFYQARPGNKGSGLGLGLYVSRLIVESHGGKIVAEFPEDGGTRFVVNLPTGVPEPQAPLVAR